MERKIIGIDFDGTISEPIPNVLALLNKRYNKNFSLGDVKKFWYNDLYGITKDELSSAYAEVLINNEKIELVEQEVPSIINELNKICDIYLVTYSFAKEQYLANWLREHGIHIKGIFIAKNKADLKRAELFIDDSPHNALDLSRSGKKVIFLKKWYYDSEDITGPNIIPVQNWREIRAKTLEILAKS